LGFPSNASSSNDSASRRHDGLRQSIQFSICILAMRIVKHDGEKFAAPQPADAMTLPEGGGSYGAIIALRRQAF
jgi:hypothetical protein